MMCTWRQLNGLARINIVKVSFRHACKTCNVTAEAFFGGNHAYAATQEQLTVLPTALHKGSAQSL